jgi:hypothetical protein
MFLDSNQEVHEVKEKHMRIAQSIVSGAVLSALVWGFAAAAPAAQPAADCQRLGGEVSALIDNKLTSPNIAAARANFQAGIMDCMEGDDGSAKTHYTEAKRLLLSDERAAPAAPAKAVVQPAVPPKSVAQPAVVEAAPADCRRVGGEASVLIDTRKNSPNIAAARAAFQVGIMDCMEGDDVAANKSYQQVKELLADAR